MRLRLEVEILLVCARTHLHPGERHRLRVLLRKEPEWERLFSLAASNGLIPLLYWHLNSAAADLAPEGFLNGLRVAFVQNAAMTLESTADLLEVLHLLEEGGILAVPYKGPVLASRVYGNVALRHKGDLDILIARHDVPRATRRLEDAGYQQRHPASQAGREFLLRNRCSEILVREPASVVELHWALSIAFPLELDQLRHRLRTQPLGGSHVPAFSAEDLLVILCIHGAKHCWNRLEWLAGVSELVRNEEMAWSEAVGRATELRAEKTLFLGLSLAHDLLEAPVPAHILEEARRRRNVIRLAMNVQQRLAAADVGMDERPNPLPRDLFLLRLQPTSRDRLRYLVHRLTIPGRKDTRLMLPFGYRSVPLPALVRPFRVAGKLIGRLISGRAIRGQTRS